MSESEKKGEEHWTKQKEAGGYNSLKFTFFLFKLFPMRLLRLTAFPVGFFYFLFSKKAKIESRRYLDNIIPYLDDPKMIKKCKSFFAPLRHIISFALALLEKIQAWGGKFKFKGVHFQDDDIGQLINELESGKGVMLIISHHGNTEVLRGLLNSGQTGVSRKIPFTAIMDLKISANFSRMLKELNPEAAMDIIGADEIGPHTAILMEERLSKGGMVLIAGDRTSPLDNSKNLIIPFLGKDAPFSSGMFYMAAIMNVSIYFIFGLRKKELSLKTEYNMHVHKSNTGFAATKKEKMEKSNDLANNFVSLMETYCKRQPFQWYNFFNFWLEGENLEKKS